MGKKEKIVPLNTQIDRLEEKLFQANKPILVDTYFHLAQLYLRKTDISPDPDTYQYIELILNKCNELDENPIFYNLIGEIHLRQNNLDKAEKAFQEAFDINKTTIETHQSFAGDIREKYISAHYLSKISENNEYYSHVCQTLDPTDLVYRPIVKDIKI